MGNIKIEPNGMYIVENVMYFSDKRSNGLFMLDLETNACNFLGRFVKEDNKPFLYYKILKNEEMLYFIPDNAASIGTYNLKNGKIDNICISETGKGSAGYFNGIIYENAIYLYPWNTGSVKRYDLKTKTFEDTRFDYANRICDSIVCNGKCYAISRESENVLCIEKSGEIHLLTFNNGFKGYSCIGIYEENLILTSITGDKVLAFNTNDKSSYLLNDIQNTMYNVAFSGCYLYDNKMLLIPCEKEYPMEISFGDNRIDTCKELCQFYDGKKNMYGTSASSESWLIIYITSQGKIIKKNLDCANGVEEIDLRCQNLTYEYYYKFGEANFENVNLSLEDFIKEITK